MIHKLNSFESDDLILGLVEFFSHDCPLDIEEHPTVVCLKKHMDGKFVECPLLNKIIVTEETVTSICKYSYN